MRALLLILAALLASALSALGQAGTTVVSAIIMDANGDIYVNCQWSAVFVGQNTSPGVGPYSPAPLLVGQQGTCDSSGNLTVNLADNVNTIKPTPSQWSFSICSAQGYVAGPYCKSNILVTITGATQSLTTTLAAVLPILPQVGTLNLAAPPSIGNVTPGLGYFSGGSLSGTYAGNSTFSGSIAFTGTDSFSGTTTFTGTDSFSGTVTSSGTNNLTGPLNLSGVGRFTNSNDFSSAGVFTPTTYNTNSTFIVNGLVPITQFENTSPGTGVATDAMTCGMVVPNSSTILQTNCLAAYIRNESTTSYPVPVFGYCLVNVASGFCWGVNTIVSDNGPAVIGTGGSITLKNEFDVNVYHTGTTVLGINTLGYWNVHPASSSAFYAGKPLGPGAGQGWDASFVSATGASPTALFAQAVATGSSQVSQSVTFSPTNSSGTGLLATIYADITGNISMNPPAGRSVNVPALVATNSITAGTPVMVAALPAASSSAGMMMLVTDSTTVSAEGQTCVGSSTNKALAFSNGVIWKCF